MGGQKGLTPKINSAVGQPKEADPKNKNIEDGQPIEACPEK